MDGFSINKRLLTGPQFTTNVSTKKKEKTLFDAWKALKSDFGRVSAPDPTGELTTFLKTT